MGIYLSTPSDEVSCENGSGNGLAYSVGEMQGWRKNMEDAHIARVDLNADGNNAIGLFGVFDGHGGKEVALFANRMFADVLCNLDAFKNGEYHMALSQAFHKIDELLEDPKYDPLLKELRAIPNPSAMHGKSRTESGSAASSLVSSAGDLASGLSFNGHAKDGDEDDDEEGGNDQITTSEAVRLIRELLHGSKRVNAAFKKTAATPLPAAEATVDDGQFAGSTPSAFAEDEASDPEEGAEDGFKGLNIESSDLWVQTSPETAVGEPTTSHHVTPHVEHEVVVDESAPIPPPPEPPLMPVSNDKVCRLAEHRVPAGCTAVVALVVQGRLIVANAGDSRGVLCRGGQAVALSHDHKPQQETETTRIEAAGGFVNFAGRVNGNLNLSRALGDLKYKQSKHLPPSAQMITAEPDIIEVELTDSDEFFILACDGIWDCLTNEQAVEYVRTRLVAGMPMHQIVENVLHDCLAENPRKSQGIGGDNMTCLIVDLRGKSQNR